MGRLEVEGDLGCLPLSLPQSVSLNPGLSNEARLARKSPGSSCVLFPQPSADVTDVARCTLVLTLALWVELRSSWLPSRCLTS